MAARTAYEAWSSGTVERFMALALYGVDTSDTVQLSSWFETVTWWAWVPATGSSTATDSTSVTSNTQVTLSPASISQDSGFLFVRGAGVRQTTS